MHDSVGFAFLVRQVPRTSHLTNPYELVSVADIGQAKEFWLFSSHGVLYTNGPYSEFCTLAEWSRAAEQYKRACELTFYRQFKLKKYFAFWHQRSTRAKYEKRRHEFESKFLLAEVELAQPILAVSALIDELDNMELLPKLSSSHWSHAHFKLGVSCSVWRLCFITKIEISPVFQLLLVLTNNTL